MGKYNAYEKYKDSGVEWLGEIPEHWSVWKVSHGFKNIGSGTTPKSDNLAFYEGDIPWITTSELRESLIEDTAQKVTQEALKNYSALKVYPKGSIAIAMYGATIGRLGILGIDAAVNQACYVFSESKIFDLPFFYYWLWMHRPNLIALSAGGGQPNLSQDDLKQLRLPTPPLPEQQAIANFLDYKTKQIDALINKKEALLEKLDEKRTAIISHAVTKGLDPNVPMKDSGVEWLGEIPEHWEVKRLNFLTKKIGDGIHSTPIYVDSSEYYFINGNNLINGNIVINESTKCVSNEEFLKYKLNLNKNTLLLSINGTIGNVAFYKDELVILGKSAAYIVLKSEISINFAYYVFLSQNTKNYFLNEVTGTTIFNLSLKSIKNTFFPAPPLPEQQAIANFLDHKTKQIDQQKLKIQQAIDRLKEYRTALITNAVTGKIDVRQVSIP